MALHLSLIVRFKSALPTGKLSTRRAEEGAGSLGLPMVEENINGKLAHRKVQVGDVKRYPTPNQPRMQQQTLFG
jgi:hypothetical protein